jgi:hypothetical protein
MEEQVVIPRTARVDRIAFSRWCRVQGERMEKRLRRRYPRSSPPPTSSRGSEASVSTWTEYAVWEHRIGSIRQGFVKNMTARPTQADRPPYKPGLRTHNHRTPRPLLRETNHGHHSWQEDEFIVLPYDRWTSFYGRSGENDRGGAKAD